MHFPPICRLTTLRFTRGRFELTISVAMIILRPFFLLAESFFLQCYTMWSLPLAMKRLLFIIIIFLTSKTLCCLWGLTTEWKPINEPTKIKREDKDDNLDFFASLASTVRAFASHLHFLFHWLVALLKVVSSSFSACHSCAVACGIFLSFPEFSWLCCCCCCELLSRLFVGRRFSLLVAIASTSCWVLFIHYMNIIYI